MKYVCYAIINPPITHFGNSFLIWYVKSHIIQNRFISWFLNLNNLKKYVIDLGLPAKLNLMKKNQVLNYLSFCLDVFSKVSEDESESGTHLPDYNDLCKLYYMIRYLSLNFKAL